MKSKLITLILTILPVVAYIALGVAVTVITSIAFFGNNPSENTLNINYLMSKLGIITISIYLLIKHNDVFKNSFSWDKYLFTSFLVAIVYFLIEQIVFEQKISYNGISTLFNSKLMSAIIISPIFEEIIFRGWIIGFLKKKKINFWATILFSSLVFAFIHSFNDSANSILVVLLKSFIFGLLLGSIYYKYQNLLYVIIIHLTYNLLVTMF